MYNYRYAAMILTGTMILGGLSGCASDDGSSGANNASTDTAKEQNTHTQTTNLENTIEFTESTFSEKEFMARVEAIDEGTLTLSILSGGMGSAPGGEEGTAPGGDMGSAPGGEMGSAPSEATLVLNDPTILQDAQGNTVDLSAVTEGTLLQITLDEDGRIASIIVSQGMGAINGAGGGPSGSMGQGMPGGGSGVESYTTVNEYTTDTTVSKENLTSTGTDENAVLVSDGATVNLEEVTVKRTSSDSTGGDNSSFYGVGAAILVTDGTVNVTDSNIMTDAAGGAGVFAYGDGIAYVTDTTITTTQNTSGGIHVAGGGTLYAKNCTVETNGASAAAIRSDSGGGTMVVEGGSYTSNGTGSPAVYVTANISVSDAALEATNSEAICIEGLNSLTLTDVDLTGNMPDQETNDCTWNVILYQSMSGDSEVGNSTFSMTGGSLTAKNGGMFYTTNTESTFYLSGVDITYAKENDFFLKCTGNANQRGWGSSGANGANCTFTANAQEMVGDIYWDSISTLDFFMENNSTLTGAILQDETNAGNGGNGYCNVTLDSTSTWIVTADSVVTSLVNQGTIVDANGKSVSIVGMDGKSYVKGDSTLTITVENYSES